MVAVRGGRPRRAGAERTRRRLLRAGRRAFARKGLAGVNLRDDVLAPARVSVGSFYHQFESKTDLLLTVLRDRSAAAREHLATIAGRRPAITSVGLARRVYVAVQGLAESDPETWRIRSRERWCDELRVRAFLRRERRGWVESLAAEHRRLARSAGLQLDAEQAAECLLGLAVARADARVEQRRGRAGTGLSGWLRFTAGGMNALGSPPRRRRSAKRDRR